MARINIEDNLWSDPRFLKLCIALGDEVRAIGAVVLAWKLAQKYWCPDRDPIPEPAFDGLPAELISCGLAEKLDNGIRMRGSEEHFSWWFNRQESGRKGGLAKASKAKQKVASLSKSKQTVPSSSISSSSSSSISNSDSSNLREKEFSRQPDIEIESKVQFFIRRYCEEFKNKYQVSPQILAKDAGIAKRLSTPLSQNRIDSILRAYFEIPDAWIIKRKYPIDAIESKMNEIVVFMESGKFTTSTETRQIDKTANTLSQLERVRRGEL